MGNNCRKGRICDACRGGDEKRCRICGGFEVSWDLFFVDKSGSRRSVHVKCRSVKVKKLMEVRSVDFMDLPTDRVCCDCGERKLISNFYMTDKKRGYYQKRCKDCHRKITSAYRINNLDKVKAYNREYWKGYKKKK